MTLEKKVQAILSTPENSGKIIVAMPDNEIFTEANSMIFIVFIRSLIKILPQIIRDEDFNFIYGDVDSLSHPGYRTDFLKKCENEIEGDVKFYTINFM